MDRPNLAPRGELLEDGKTIRVTLANQGTGASGPLRIRLGSPACRAEVQAQPQTQRQAEIGTGKPIDGCRRLLRLLDSLVEDAAVQSIPALGTRPVSFGAQKRLNVKDLERLSLLAYRTQGPATDWDFPAIPISGPSPVWLLTAAALLLFATVGAVYYWRRYQHPLVTTIGHDAQAIFALAPSVCRRRSGGCAYEAMSRPFRADPRYLPDPGRCPGLVCRAPSGLRVSERLP